MKRTIATATSQTLEEVVETDVVVAEEEVTAVEKEEEEEIERIINPEGETKMLPSISNASLETETST